MIMSIVNESELPIGFRMELSMDLNAMEQFCSLDQSAREQLIKESRSKSTKEEMHQFVSAIRDGAMR